MKVRDYPHFNYKGLSSWPPVWSWVSGPVIKHAKGEIGVLTKVEPTLGPDHDRCFLHIQYDGGHFMGSLHIAHSASYERILAFFRKHIGEEISVIGDLDISDLL